MLKRCLWLVVLLSIAHRAHAANLGPFADFQPVGTGIQAVAYLLAGGLILFTGIRAGQAYRDRDMGGMGPVVGLMALTVIEAIFVGTIMPGLLAPISALAATP